MTRRAYAIIIAALCTVSIAYSIRYSYGMLLPEMLPDLAISKTEAGTIFAAYFVVYTLFTPVLGTLSDLYNYRLLLTVFTVILGAGAMLMATAGSFMQAGLIFSIAALGHAACWAPVAALVQKWVPDNKRGMAMSIVTMGVGMGLFLWGNILPLIVAASNWRFGWLAMGACALGVATVNLFLVRNPPAPVRPKIGAAQQLRLVRDIYRELLKDRTFWYLAMAYLCVGFNVLIPFTYLTVYAREVLQLDYGTSTRLVALVAMFSIPGQLLFGTLSDSVGRVNILILCGVIMGSACLGMIYFQSERGMYAVAGLYGLGYGAVWPVYAAAASDFFDRSKTGSVVGLWTVYLGIGSIIAPVIGGLIIDFSGSYNGTFLTGFASGIMSALILVRLRSTRTSTQPTGNSSGSQ